MIRRIPQRTKDDRAICTVAMVMGLPYSYDRVLEDSHKYALYGYPQVGENAAGAGAYTRMREWHASDGSSSE
jgi:hypothetical protein